MVRTYFLLIFILISHKLIAQNLVPDSSFEDTTKDACLFLDPPRYITEYFNDWYVPTGASTDLWNSDTTNNSNCSNTISTLLGFASPIGRGTYFPARSGKFFLGMFTTYSTKKDYTYREYIQVRLKKPLVIGKVYYAQMFVRPPFENIYAFSNNMGMYFSADSVIVKDLNFKYGSPILIEPQVNDTTIIDKKIWNKVSGFFKADKSYQFLTIGNFFDDVHTKRSNLIERAISVIGGPVSYYCLDDVSVWETSLDSLPISPNLGHDTTLCAGQSLLFNLPNQSGTTYRWQDGSTELRRTINQSGTYYVTAITQGYSVTDTIHVSVLPRISLPPDTVLCRGERLTLAPSYPSKYFLWSDSSRNATLTISQAGQYWVQVPSAYCVLADTIDVRIVDCPGIPPNVITPNGDGINDRFVIDNIELQPWNLTVVNRWGRIVYEAEPYRNDWQGGGLPGGTYYYRLWSRELRRSIKGWITIFY